MFSFLNDYTGKLDKEIIDMLSYVYLVERPSIVVYIEAMELPTRCLWGAQVLVTAFYKPFPLNIKVVAFSRDVITVIMTPFVAMELACLYL